MENKIFQLAYDYVINGKDIDKNYIDDVVDIIVNYYDLNRYVTGVDFSDESPRKGSICSLGCYDSTFKEVKIYTENFFDFQDSLDKPIESLSDFEFRLYKILYGTHLVIHEIVHASQFKIACDRNVVSDIATICRACYKVEMYYETNNFMQAYSVGLIDTKWFDDLVEKSIKDYHMFYRLNPVERQAECDSYAYIIKMLNLQNDKFDGIKNIFQILLERELLKNYNMVRKSATCPTHMYLIGTDDISYWKQLSFYDKDKYMLTKNAQDQLSLYRRLSLGLPTFNEEQKSQRDVCRRLLSSK